MPDKSGGGGAAGGGGDNSLGAVWVMVALFTAVILVGYFAHDIIITLLFKIKLFEISIISLFTNDLYNIQQWIYQTPPAAASYTEVYQVSQQVGRGFISYPTAVLLVAFAIYFLFGSVSKKFNKIFDMKSLKNSEKENWPQITPVVDLDLVKQSVFEGPWAMSMRPMEFCKKYDLIIEEEFTPPGEILAKKTKIIATLNKNTARKIFATQLGAPWQGPKKLNIYTRALFAIFAARANHDTDASTKMLRQISASAGSEDGKLNFKGVDELLDKYIDSEVVKFVCSRHAYVLTNMASMLQVARTDGVLASADFLWLKPVDRMLWYMLNNIGRQTAYAEVAGPFAHWLVEISLERKIKVPMIDQAITGLEVALQEIEYIPEGDVNIKIKRGT